VTEPRYVIYRFVIPIPHSESDTEHSLPKGAVILHANAHGNELYIYALVVKVESEVPKSLQIGTETRTIFVLQAGHATKYKPSQLLPVCVVHSTSSYPLFVFEVVE
jgi:hypothetical protein